MFFPANTWGHIASPWSWQPLSSIHVVIQLLVKGSGSSFLPAGWSFSCLRNTVKHCRSHLYRYTHLHTH